MKVISSCLILVGALSLHAAEPSPSGPAAEKRFPPLQLPAGFKATLFACDPMIEYPSVIAAGPRTGSLFVAIDYMTGLGTGIERRDDIERIGKRRNEIGSRHRTDLQRWHAQRQEVANDLDLAFGGQCLSGQLKPVPQGHVLQVQRAGRHGATSSSTVLPAPVSRRAMVSATRSAADVMMSRLPA